MPSTPPPRTDAAPAMQLPAGLTPVLRVVLLSLASLAVLTACGGSSSGGDGGALAAKTPTGFQVVLEVDPDAEVVGNFVYRSLNAALQAAHDAVAQGTDPGAVVVRVKGGGLPVAPVGYGGVEPVDGGWLAEGETGPRPAFPVRLVPGVRVEGVPHPLTKLPPRITVSEVHAGGARFEDWGERAALVLGADGATLSGFTLVGRAYLHKSSDGLEGVYARAVAGFTVEDCLFDNLFDGLCLTADTGERLTATVRDCSVFGSFPFLGGDVPEEDQGHAGLWVTGRGDLEVSITGCTFGGSHDGVEIAGVEDRTTALVLLSRCDFLGNENGLEVVGGGQIEFEVDRCLFVGNHNLPGGVPFVQESGAFASTAGIAIRGRDIQARVRGSRFHNNGYGVLWLPSSNSVRAELDLGRHPSLDPGLNVFTLDLDAFAVGTNPVRVCLMNAAPPGQAPVWAAGNTWHAGPGAQGAETDGVLRGVVLAGPGGVNLPKIDGQGLAVPPGPLDGVCCDPDTDEPWLRNFSIAPAAAIDFGTL